jgi:stage III sporulation protein AE
MKRCWKRPRFILRLIFCVAVFAVFFSIPIYALDTSSSQTQNDYYQKQMEESGANDLTNSVPDSTRKILDNLGVDSPDWKSISGVTLQSIFSQITGIAGEKGAAPLKAAISILAIMLLCSLLNSMKLSFGDKPLGGVIGMVGTLCICTVVISPIVSCIGSAANIIKGAADFMLACVPVIVGIMIAAGQGVSAGSYNLLMVGAGNVISLLAANFFVPLLNIFLAFSIVSAISPNLNLNGLCETFSKAVKWALGFCMTVFTGLLTLQSIVGTSADSTGNKAAKFVISNFVPVVGNALGDAFNTV